MKLRSSSFWLALVSLVAVLLIATADFSRTSPGDLSAVHGREDVLTGSQGCRECHGGFRASLADACLECHAAVGSQIAAGSGLHGKLEEVPAKACGTCHGEHHGIDFSLVDATSFALAGVPDRDLFDHRTLGYVLEGRHDQLECSECHPHADALVLERGTQRFGGLDGACTTCHEDPHEGQMARGCAECHGQEGSFDELLGFRHQALALTGAHDIECRACHAAGEPYSIEAVAGIDPPDARDCGACHTDPHSRTFLDGVAAFVGEPVTASCIECHDPAHASFLTTPDSALNELHGLSGFALDPPHRDLACADCHGDPAQAFDERYPGRAADTCAACHEDPHGGQFEGSAFAAQGCVGCHESERFVPHAFGVEEHGRTDFPLTGGHEQLECAACHERPEPGEPRLFHGTARACEDCHVDVHRGFFSEALAALPERGGCASCHGTESFALSYASSFDHAGWTGFELAGAHARASCDACHPRGAPDAAGRTLGFVADYANGPPTECASCHRDVHGDAFEGTGLPARVEGREGCARCHDETSFRGEAAERLDHRWTGFALAGAHAQTSCEQCHPPLPSATVGGRTFARASDQFGSIAGCDSCHADPHAQVFDGPARPVAVESRAGCARCHLESSFRVLALEFDHAQWTGYALDAAHAAVDCSGCHAPLTDPDSLGRTFERASGTACADCHSDPHAGQFAVVEQDCASCHAAASGFLELSFDHQTDARFALDATHAKLDCSACHKAWPLPGGGEVVRFRPLGIRCQDCHTTEFIESDRSKRGGRR